MNVITLPEKEKKRVCPSCSGEMYRLSDCSSLIFVCEDCGGSIEPRSSDNHHYECENEYESEENKENSNNQLNKLFNHLFMKKYTTYENFYDFIYASGLIPKNVAEITFEIFKSIPRKKLDKYIKINTKFKTWNEMFDLATGKYLRIEF